MSYQDVYSNMVFRAEIKEVLENDGSKLQQVLATGYAGEELKMIRVQQHGITSRPPAGSLAMALAINGRRENALLFGGEMPGGRKNGNGGDGSVSIYDKAGQRFTLDNDKVSMVALGPFTMTQTGGEWKLTSDSKVTIEAPMVILGKEAGSDFLRRVDGSPTTRVKGF